MNIKKLPVEERPRERLFRDGPEGLSESELLSILLGTGKKGTSALELSAKLLYSVPMGLIDISKLAPQELCKFDGIGAAKACQITAALELGKRLNRQIARAGIKRITSANEAANFFIEDMGYLQKEVFKALLLDCKGNIVSVENISVGDISSAPVNPREVFSVALRKNAFALILVHNHPSGDVTPSNADINITERLVEIGRLMGISVTDHIIIGKNSYYSFKEKELM